MGWGLDREVAGGEAGGGQASAAEDGICQRESVDLLPKPRRLDFGEFWGKIFKHGWKEVSLSSVGWRVSGGQ